MAKSFGAINNCTMCRMYDKPGFIINAGQEIRCFQCNPTDCRTCRDIAEIYAGFGPTHNGSPNCKNGSIASGGIRVHCTCDTCF
jgi:hypothetical protein